MSEGGKQCLPSWTYKAQAPAGGSEGEEGNSGLLSIITASDTDLGSYVRDHDVTNAGNGRGRAYFDLGLRLMLGYQHEIAARCFLHCLTASEHCALAHAFVSLCHSPNYNFKGEAYYASADRPEEAVGGGGSIADDLLCVFPSQQLADRHSRRAVEKIEEIRKLRGRESETPGRDDGSGRGKGGNGNQSGPEGTNNGHLPDLVSDVESRLIYAIRTLTRHPGLDPSLSEDTAGRPYADAMRGIYELYPNDPEVAYCFVEALMVLNAWQLFEFPTGKPLSSDVGEIRDVLERSLILHKNHAGLCHMYVHLCEMSSEPEKALAVACKSLRENFPDAGHLIHMPTHIDVLMGDYEDCVHFNCKAIQADERSMQITPGTSGPKSFYFGYIAHDYHMAVYGALLGGFEAKAMDLSKQLNRIVCEDFFEENPSIAVYLESYSALDIHTMVRFGRWKELLEVKAPRNSLLMLFRAASIKAAKCLAHASLGNIIEAKREADILDGLRNDPECRHRILHNNTVGDLLAVDSVMVRGEIAYHAGTVEEAFDLLRKAVGMQDNLNYDEPWGKMQPIRHALGGLLLDSPSPSQGRIVEAEAVFRKDLLYHPKNPWALVGLISALKKKHGRCCGCSEELKDLIDELTKQRASELADFDIRVACACCTLR